jgi:hypothetical protein
MGPTPVMMWGGPLIVGQPLTWPPQPSLVGYSPPPPPAGHPGQSSSAPPPASGRGYWLSPWAAPARGQAPPWGMPSWTTPMLQPQQPSSLPQMVRHLCLLSIVYLHNMSQCRKTFVPTHPFVFKRPSSSAGYDFVDAVLNVGGSDKGNGGGTSNNEAP